jgi:hypothetical protein
MEKDKSFLIGTVPESTAILAGRLISPSTLLLRAQVLVSQGRHIHKMWMGLFQPLFPNETENAKKVNNWGHRIHPVGYLLQRLPWADIGCTHMVQCPFRNITGGVYVFLNAVGCEKV